MGMEEKIQKALAMHGLEGIQLTEDERKELEYEIKQWEQGHLFLDGILTNPNLRKRKWNLDLERDDERL